MAKYIIGDVQGCFDSLMALFDEISFNELNDELIFAGDVINRGPKSLETLRFISRVKNCSVVLGNHDLHLLAIDAGYRSIEDCDSMQDILQAADRQTLIDYLYHCQFAKLDGKNNIIVVHAGIPPKMNLSTFKKQVENLNETLGKNPEMILNNMKKNEFAYAVTSIRFCKQDGEIDYSFKGNVDQGRKKGLTPWFEHLDVSFAECTILFGHWAALNVKTNQKKVIGLDTGCVYGGRLSAYCVDDEKMYSVKAVENGVLI